MSNLPPFYVGQKVVCINKNPLYLKYNETYVVKEIKQFPCGCWAIDVGVSRNNSYATYCYKHDSAILDRDCWYTVDEFAPIEQTFQSISFKEVIKIESPLIGIN